MYSLTWNVIILSLPGNVFKRGEAQKQCGGSLKPSPIFQNKGSQENDPIMTDRSI
jgi:hypothetical protein